MNKRAAIDMDWVIAIAFSVGLAYGVVTQIHSSSTRRADSAEASAMQALYDEWQACMHAELRSSECILEYDGDGSSYTPADYGWYWRQDTETVQEV